MICFFDISFRYLRHLIVLYIDLYRSPAPDIFYGLLYFGNKIFSNFLVE